MFSALPRYDVCKTDQCATTLSDMQVLHSQLAKKTNPFLGDKLNNKKWPARNRTKYTYAAANPIKNVDPYGLDLSDNRNRNIGLGGGCVAGAIIFGKAGAAGCAVTGPGYLGCEATAMLCGCLGGAIGGSLFGLGADAVETVVNNVGADGDETEDAGTDDLTGSDDGDLGPTSSDDVAQGIGKIASGTGLSERDVRDRIHGAKGNLPKSAGIRNPDVGVDLDTGEIYPVNPDGSLGDSIGNIYDEPGGYR